MHDDLNYAVALIFTVLCTIGGFFLGFCFKEKALTWILSYLGSTYVVGGMGSISKQYPDGLRQGEDWVWSLYFASNLVLWASGLTYQLHHQFKNDAAYEKKEIHDIDIKIDI